MSFFKRKEKNVIPEPERPDYSRQGSAGGGGPAGSGNGGSSGGGRFGRSKKEEPDPEGFEKLPSRKYQRDQYNYQPTQRSQPAGGYGNYGNYQQQPGGVDGQQGGAGSGGATGGGYGGYGGYQNSPDARNELFKGSRPPNSQTGAAFDQYAGGNRSDGGYNPGKRTGVREQDSAPDYGEGGQEDAGDEYGQGQSQDQIEEDDEVEAIKQQIRFTKQESLSTTRNAIRTAREAEETATNTLAKLGQQTDRISNTELALDRAKGYNSRAADGAKEIKRLNQSIFKPSIQFNKAAKRDAEEQRILARHLEEKADREEARQAAYASRQRVEQGFREAEQSTRGRFGFSRGGGSSNNDDGEGLSGAPKTGRAKWEQGGRYQFEATNSDDELEQELDSNLDEIAGLTSRLKILASTAGQEIDAQNKHLDKVSGKVDTLDDKILMNTQYLKRIK